MFPDSTILCLYSCFVFIHVLGKKQTDVERDSMKNGGEKCPEHYFDPIGDQNDVWPYELFDPTDFLLHAFTSLGS